MEPIAVYRESRIEASRRFELFDKSMRIVGVNILHSEFDLNVGLAGLKPQMDRICVRSKLFVIGMWISILGAIIDSVLVSGFKMPMFEFASGLMLILIVTGLVVAVAGFKKIEFARFTSEAEVVVFDIGRCGPDKDQFDEFVGLVLERIRKVKQ